MPRKTTISSLYLFLLTFLVLNVFTILLLDESFCKTEKTRALLPFSGRHNIIHHYFNKGQKMLGKTSGLVYTRKGLTAQGFQSQNGQIGEYCSEGIRMNFPSRELVLTWNADVPSLTWLQIQFRVKGNDENWSSWYDIALWGVNELYERNTLDEIYGHLDVDILKAQRNFNLLQYCVRFFSQAPNTSPTLTHVTVSHTYPPNRLGENIMIDAPIGKHFSLSVPWLSQLLTRDVENDAMIDAGVCGPASLTMVLNYYGKKVRIKHVGLRAYDPVVDIYGNWAFLAATAGEHDLYAWVQRFNNWKEVRKIVESGIPLIISIAYPQGTFSQEPERTSDGHLLVVRGFTSQGDVICNDPGTAYRKKGDGLVYKWHELGKAFFGHGGTAIVIKKKAQK